MGTGAIASAIVTGLHSGGNADYSSVLSPRNTEAAAALARQFPGVSVAGSNQQVVDSCETVVIAVRPQIVREVLVQLHFREDQSIISLVSGLALDQVAGLVAPAHRVSRAVPLPSTARRRCPTAIFPRDPVSEKLFSLLGAAFAVETEREFNVFCSATSTMAAYFAFGGAIAGWLEREGVPQAQARDYTARVLSGLAAAAMENPQRSFSELAADHATRGGMNEQFLRDWSASGTFDAFSRGLDAILRRVNGA